MKLEDLTKYGTPKIVIGLSLSATAVYLGYRAYMNYLIENNYQEFQKFSDARITPDKLRERGLI